jgi:hypothetical protein
MSDQTSSQSASLDAAQMSDVDRVRAEDKFYRSKLGRTIKESSDRSGVLPILTYTRKGTEWIAYISTTNEDIFFIDHVEALSALSSSK